MDQINIKDILFQVELVRNDSGKFRIEVKRDNFLRVSVPPHAEDQAIKTRVLGKTNWILNQHASFQDLPIELPPRQYVSGEGVYLVGKQYHLEIREGENSIKTLEQKIIVSTDSNTDRTKYIEGWLKEFTHNFLETRFTECLELFNLKLDLNFSPKLSIKKMKRRWGSCSAKGTITLNTELIAAKERCIDYVIYHELSHLIELNHSETFYMILDKVCPSYKDLKRQLDSETQLIALAPSA